MNQFLSKLESHCVSLAEKGFVPDSVIRLGIRKLLKERLVECALDGNVETQQEYLEDFVRDLKSRKIAEQTKKANDQHYEVPAELYLKMLGKNLKYSSCLFEAKDTTLDEAEDAMLNLVCRRSELDDLPKGSVVLDLGCGWGSCALFVAKKYPELKVKCVSNSLSQQEFINNLAKSRGITNLKAETCDINDMEYPEKSIDRVISNEMFEHMKNYDKLFRKISSWLKNDGKLFVHIFTHKQFTYHFEDGWMAETFFSGGTMPGQNLLLKFNTDLKCESQWAVNGTHYSKTLEAWLKKIDENKKDFTAICEKIYGKENAQKWVFNWRLFNMACSELFNFNAGNEWFVSHYLFSRTK